MLLCFVLYLPSGRASRSASDNKKQPTSTKLHAKNNHKIEYETSNSKQDRKTPQQETNKKQETSGKKNETAVERGVLL